MICMKNLLLFLILLIQFVSYSQVGIEIPKYQDANYINHAGYAVSYNHHYRQANWVAYVLTRSKLNKVTDRENEFYVDPLISETDNEIDYKGSGYDRGHLSPASDNSYSEITMKESFYYSNMSPQVPGFNRGVWKKMEEQVRDWSELYDSLYVVTGPVLTPDLPQIGPHKISVPTYYYKVVLDFHKGKEKVIGFLIKNESSSLTIQNFVKSIDEIEAITKIDFFYQIADDIENKLESSIMINSWNWNYNRNTITNTNSKKTSNTKKQKIEEKPLTNEKPCESIQCSGFTQSGTRCKRKTNNCNGRCYQH